MKPRTALLLPLLLAAALPARADGTAKSSLNADGTTSLTYSSNLDAVGTVFGMDLSAAAASAAPAVSSGAGDLGGTAYARMSLQSLPDWMLWQKGTVNLSVNPSDAQSKVATTFSRTVPIGAGLAATVADTYTVATGSDAWETDKSVSLNLTDMGTSLSVIAKATQETRSFLPTLSAQQKVLGDLSVTTALTDTGSSLAKSITAGFSHRW
ncbi:hypothetical protein V5F59_06425 [Xanthobacter autotrophicus DSM 431]|uniref:hypothetical protein n=1 Tax=Xanthobacter nonsaccharivorans TaxID=3119912 RepID=UPI003727E159